MADKDVVVVRLVFTDSNYVPDGMGMDNISRLFQDVFVKGGVLVIPEGMTVELIKKEVTEALLLRQKEGQTLDMEILNAVKAVEIQHIRVSFE